jgi:hypothetical protein
MKTISILSILFLLFSCTKIETTTNVSKTSIVENNSKFNIFRISKNEMNFGVSTTKPEDSDFYINSNFFEEGGQSIGLVVVDGLRHSDRIAGGGYFYVVNGIPHVKVGQCPTMTEFASQSKFWVLNDGVKNQRLLNAESSKVLTERIIIGEDSKGNIMVVGTSDGNSATIEETIDFAIENGMVEAILLDGGSSVDYKLKDTSSEYIVKSLPSVIKFFGGIDEPPVYICGNYK